MKPIICIAPAPAVEPMFFNDGWMVNKKYYLGVTAGGGVPVMATDIELAEEYARLCDGLILTGQCHVYALSRVCRTSQSHRETKT